MIPEWFVKLCVCVCVDSQQARLFNDPASGYDVLVASDAIGMGLNLNIRRIVFHTLTKSIQQERVMISTQHIKQIAGILQRIMFYCQFV
jgi:ATP-dependent RNA helicase SUPV3L1/SUV3